MLTAPAVADAAPTLVEGSEQKEDSQFTLNLRPKRSCRLKIGKLESPKSPGMPFLIYKFTVAGFVITVDIYKFTMFGLLLTVIIIHL